MAQSKKVLVTGGTGFIGSHTVVAGIVSNAEDYVYSSARDYCGEKGLLDIILIEPSGTIRV